MRAAIGMISLRRLAPVLPALALAAVALVAAPAGAQEDHSGLTRESFRRNCLLCHGTAAPEGISPDILAGLHPTSRLRPAEAMPGVTCWRRCDACKLPAPTRPRG